MIQESVHLGLSRARLVALTSEAKCDVRQKVVRISEFSLRFVYSIREALWLSG